MTELPLSPGNRIVAVLERTRALTKIDLESKSIFSLFASAAEELGELSRELKIEEGEFGNTHKEGDEGSQMESVDLAICALALYYARGGTTDDLAYKINAKLDKWEKAQN